LIQVGPGLGPLDFTAPPPHLPGMPHVTVVGCTYVRSTRHGAKVRCDHCAQELLVTDQPTERL